jgi:hypothetical protein
LACLYKRMNESKQTDNYDRLRGSISQNNSDNGVQHGQDHAHVHGYNDIFLPNQYHHKFDSVVMYDLFPSFPSIIPTVCTLHI